MPQIQMPVFPPGVTHITHELAFEKRDGRVTYFNGSMPVFAHDAADITTFRMITSQFCVNGNTKQVEIVKAFGVTAISVKRSVATYRESGAAGFYRPRQTRGGAILTPSVLDEAQAALRQGQSIPEIAKALKVATNTMHKAVQDGRLKKPVAEIKKKPCVKTAAHSPSR